MASKRITDHVEHRLVLGLADYPDPASGGAIKKHVECTYSNGQKIHGPKAHSFPHPEIVLSISEQDTIHWSSTEPFHITIPTAPSGLFFRPLPWVSKRGKDGLHHVNSGPMNPDAAQFMPPKGHSMDFKAFKCVSDTNPAADPTAIHLDPHIIVEP